MRSPFAPKVGGVLSADIAVPEHERELEFYRRVLTTGRHPLWQDDLMNNQGMPIIGLGARTEEYKDLPLQWMPHFQVAYISDSVAKAVELGGQELMHGKNDEGESQWAVLQDSNGAAFGLIPVVQTEEDFASSIESMGHIAWLSLVASDVGETCKFYERVIGWTAVPVGGDGVFEMQRPDGVVSAEIRRPLDTEKPIPQVWLISVLVGDLQESLQLVRDGGGEIVKHSEGSNDAVIRDPVGVYFALQAMR